MNSAYPRCPICHPVQLIGQEVSLKYSDYCDEHLDGVRIFLESNKRAAAPFSCAQSEFYLCALMNVVLEEIHRREQPTTYPNTSFGSYPPGLR